MYAHPLLLQIMVQRPARHGINRPVPVLSRLEPRARRPCSSRRRAIIHTFLSLFSSAHYRPTQYTLLTGSRLLLLHARRSLLLSILSLIASDKYKTPTTRQILPHNTIGKAEMIPPEHNLSLVNARTEHLTLPPFDQVFLQRRKHFNWSSTRRDGSSFHWHGRIRKLARFLSS